METYKGYGYEIDLTANLTRSWRLMLNYSLPKTEQADIGPGLRAYVAANRAAWEAGASNPALPNRARIATNIGDIDRKISGYAEGRTLNNTVERIGNIYTTYSFREGRLKGFSVGGGANYRGKQVVGNVTNQPFTYLYATPTLSCPPTPATSCVSARFAPASSSTSLILSMNRMSCILPSLPQVMRSQTPFATRHRVDTHSPPRSTFSPNVMRESNAELQARRFALNTR